ncbi:MAG: hypothetical protein WD407_01190 [Rhodospirillales bacterium]
MANAPKPKETPAPQAATDPAQDQAVMYTRGASGRVYGAKGQDGGAAAAQPQPAPPKPPAANQPAPKKAAAPKPTPKPTPKPAPVKRPATAKEHSRVLAQTVVTSFVDRLTLEAGRKGGVLTIQDIENLNEEFEQKMGALQTVFEASFEHFLKIRDTPDEARPKAMPFNRLIVSRFARYFKDGAISRRILPGFNMAIDMMLGPELLDGYQEKCRAIMKRIGGGDEDKCDLKTYYYDKEAGQIALDAQIAMTFHFKNFERRVEWFVDLVNDHMPPPDQNADKKDADYTFTKGDLIRVLDAMLTDLQETLSTEAGRLAITKQYGVDTIVQLADTLQIIQDIRDKQKAAAKQA